VKTPGRARRIPTALVVLAMLLGAAPGPVSPASGAGSSRGGGSGGSQVGRGHIHGDHGHRGHFHGRHFVGSGVFLDVSPWWWGGPYWYYPPPYWYYDPWYSHPPPEPQVYVERPQAYWYYCQDPPGYYPEVPNCAMQWLKVAPQPPR
jgi:hypothetical protein